MLVAGAVWLVMRQLNAPYARHEGTLSVTDGAIHLEGRGDPLVVPLVHVRDVRRLPERGYGLDLADGRTLSLVLQNPSADEAIYEG